MNRTELVREFHEKHDFPLDVPLQSRIAYIGESAADESLRLAADLLKRISQQWESGDIGGGQTFDTRLMRAHLIVEETAEILRALADRDAVALLDGLADCSYVIDGTAGTYGLPLQEAFEEVHRSNMTKQRMSEGDVRIRDKGPDYQPPNLKKVLDQHWRK